VFGVDHSEMSRERIVTGEGFLLGAKWAVNLLLAGVVDSIFVACEIVRPREYRVAWLSSAGINPLALVRSSLRVACCCTVLSRHYSRIPMSLAFVPLQFGRCVKPEGTTMIRASVSSSIRSCPGRLLNVRRLRCILAATRLHRGQGRGEFLGNI